jgi:iron(III) transport system ATP-binding protein
MLTVKNLRKTYLMDDGRVEAVRDVSFQLPEGMFLTLLGPSGCGKSTILRCIAGLEDPDEGEIYIGGQPIKRQGTLVPAYKRGIGMVFQSYAIWPHMSVSENVAFPLVHGGFKKPKAEVKERVKKVLQLVGLGGLETRPAPFLSGGQQQRVALARALVYEPRLLLLDEPLSNLDAKLREEMRSELRGLLQRLRISTLYVTHDQEEALSMSDQIAVVYSGQILQKGTPSDIYLRPQHPFVASFIGKANFAEGQIMEQVPEQRMVLVESSLGKLYCSGEESYSREEKVLIVFRPEDVIVHTDTPCRSPNCLSGVLERMFFVGNRVQSDIRVASSFIQVETGSHLQLQMGDKVVIEIPAERIRILRTHSS